MDFYNDEQQYLESRVLEAGDVILLITGGHGFEVLEEVEMIEVKQGPYVGERDKTRFEAKKTEDVGQRGQRTGVRGQQSEVRRQRTEGTPVEYERQRHSTGQGGRRATQ